MAKNDIISLKEKIALLEEESNALNTEKQRLTYLLAASPAIIYSFEAKEDYLPTFISENVKKIFGYEPSEYL
jgi:PAS domain-containing protein